MKHLKYITVFFLIAWFLGASCQQVARNEPEHRGLELSANLGGMQWLDTMRIIHIATTIFNPTNDTLSFVTMSCSYEDMFVTDTAIFKVQSRYDCYKNGPAITSIPPKGKLDQFIMIRPTVKNSNIFDSKLKIGMYLLTPEKAHGFERIEQQYEKRQSAKILWSNELDLQRLYRRIYK